MFIESDRLFSALETKADKIVRDFSPCDLYKNVLDFFWRVKDFKNLLKNEDSCKGRCIYICWECAIVERLHTLKRYVCE